MSVTSAYSKKCIDLQESIVEPLHGKNKMPYYHRELSRVPEIDDCGVNDKVGSNRKRDILSKQNLIIFAKKSFESERLCMFIIESLKACFYEANEQFRLDKMVDGFILQVSNIHFYFQY